MEGTQVIVKSHNGSGEKGRTFKNHDILDRIYFRFPPGGSALHSSPNYKTDRLRMCE